MPLLGDSQYEHTISRMQDADHRATCQRRDEDGAEALELEVEELLRWFDTPEPRLPSPPEEMAAARLARRIERLAAAGVVCDGRDWE